jgi:RHS repeat-associated protein
MLSRISSRIDSLILVLVLVLLASNAYAQFSPVPFIDLEYFYDGVGNVDRISDYIDPQNNCTMQYDDLDRLTVADGPWGAGSYTYDSIGNRTSKDINGQNISYTYGTSDNRLSGFSYDANGNVIGDGTFTYDYDSENRLIQVTNGTDAITYGYDGEGRRISQTINGETTIFAYGVGLNVLTEFSGTGVPKFDYIYAGSRNIARINFDGSGVPVSKAFYHPDHLGSTIGLTDQETTKVWDRMYLPYGGTFTGTGSTENTHQYTAKELEAATGLYYYGARYHNPSIGRFMSVDPAGADPTDPQSWNRYAYVKNNPYKYVDPDGSMECSVLPEGVETSPSGMCGAIGGGGGRWRALPPGPKQLALPKPSSIRTSQSSFIGGFIERVNRVIFRGPGVNITPRSVANTYRIIGKGNRTFVTNVESFEKIIGPLKGDRLTITSEKARELERELGLKKNSLESRNIISIVGDLASRAPGSPVQGNVKFIGGGKGLPGGGPELTISGINSAGGGDLRQIILEVVE